MSMVELNCFILGDDSSRIFGVEILNTENVSTLKDLIKEKLSPKLNYVAASDLAVWKVSLPADSITQELTVADVPVQPLHSVTRISSIFKEAPVDEYVHIVVQAPPVNQPVAAPDPEKPLTLNCLLLPADEHRPFTVGISRDRSSRIFDVDILKTRSVSTLKDLIKEKRSPDLNYVVASALTVWKVSLPVDNISPEFTVNNVQPLEPLTKISSVFSEALVDGHIHVLVQAPPVVPQKRERSTSDDLYERAKRSKIVITPPSTAGKPDVYQSLQKDPSQKIFDDHSKPDPNVAPAALLYEGFGHFLDIMDGRPGVPGLADIDTTKLFSEVDEFACKMNEDYADEDLRREAVLPYLNRIFKARRDIRIPSLHASAIGSVIIDGHNDATHGAGTTVVKFKNRITGISAIPEVELTGYVARLNLRGMEVHRKLHLGWRVPYLGLIIVGESGIPAFHGFLMQSEHS